MNKYIYRPKEQRRKTGNSPDEYEIFYLRKAIFYISNVNMDL